MLFKKKGIPEDSELVLCTVTKIYPHCVFLSLDEYEHKSGMAHISEISPGRIRNIGDYVKLGSTAPKSIPVHRKEIYEAIQRENIEAAKNNITDLKQLNDIFKKKSQPEKTKDKNNEKK